MFTGQNQLPSNAPVTVVCIDRILNGLPVGTFYNAYQPGPVAFWGLGELVLKMDALFDLIGFPNPAFQLRSFQRKDVPRRRAAPAASALRTYWEPEAFAACSGALGTFVIHPLYRQNASWQGYVEWLEGKKTESFRSALELMHLVDQAIGKRRVDKQVCRNAADL
ncbi:hypothetical protein [Anaerotruncus rubiinfantis]|uniref:hypothetical protein n=1 Tax=Anaerotruncus rubiinfantis TaxID=1720200 RepID=UPI000A6B168D|nr:hypothetical protein [Anaerotruncus rubiinfantis]